ncbi:MAG: flagellar basal body rod protein FlgC [Proteobacteria bacterium]|nr:flagellar basal body rod protein FlgC [Pseudomonadota bacterium]
MEELFKALAVSASGLRAQSQRMRIIAENMANAKSLPQSPDQEPYRRKILTFSSRLDRALGVDVVKVNKVQFDQSAFTRRYDPSHPGANDEGYVLQPNVTALIESMDMREAQRTYEANLSMISTARAMLMRTIGIIN